MGKSQFDEELNVYEVLSHLREIGHRLAEIQRWASRLKDEEEEHNVSAES